MKKVLKFLLEAVIQACLILGYVGFMFMVESHLPFFKYEVLDYLAMLGLFSTFYYSTIKLRTDLFKLINHENKSTN